jgi:hypothetical protein
MHSTTRNRRQFLAAGTLGGTAALAGTLPLAAATPAPPGVMSRERYLQYVGWFNANDPRFLDFYHPQVVLELGNATLEGSKAIRDFYAAVKAHIHEKVEVSHYIADAGGIGAELPTEFKVYKDWPTPNYFNRPLQAGEVFRVVSFGLYWIENGQFRRIKAARYKLVNDWRMEA